MTSYFGLREVGVTTLPGLGHPYVALNGAPVYLQMTLDQGFHPDGFTTWPSDEAMREEILIARRLGLNAIRTHVKVELPRKLYWADRLGVLVMSDVPNSWGEPDTAMRQEWETALRGMLRRDFNHPAIFSWVLFNEQWGLLTKGSDGKKAYLPETQAWVETRYDLAKSLDPTRLVEDNSPCCGGGHVKTDLNSWHMYLPGWKWTAELDAAEARTAPGSAWNYLGGRTQKRRADAQQRVRQRLGLRGLDRRRRLELRLPRDDRRVPAPPEDRGLALHRAPRRGERVERLRARRPLGEADGPGRARARDDAARLARAFLRGARRLSHDRREAGRDRVRAAVGVVPDRRFAGA